MVSTITTEYVEDSSEAIPGIKSVFLYHQLTGDLTSQEDKSVAHLNLEPSGRLSTTLHDRKEDQTAMIVTVTAA